MHAEMLFMPMISIDQIILSSEVAHLDRKNFSLDENDADLRGVGGGDVNVHGEKANKRKKSFQCD